MTTIGETLSNTERQALRQLDAEGSLPDHYVPNTVRHPTASPIERDVEGARTTVEWTNHELEMISLSVQGRNNWTDHDMYCFRRDLYRQIRSLISFWDFDENLDFIAYENAASECMKAYSNGKRTARKHAAAIADLASLDRETNNMEWDDTALQRANKRVDGYADRLWAWREYYMAARQVYREVVSELGPNFAQWCDAEWTPPDVAKQRDQHGKSLRKKTAAFYEAQARVLKAERERHFQKARATGGNG
jgi:hypothetical protein